MLNNLKYKIARKKLDHDFKKAWEHYQKPANVEYLADVQYGPDEKWNKVDIYYPAGTVSKLPTIIDIHGGGYVVGDKSHHTRFCISLAQHGFTVVNMNYRMVPEYHYPAPLIDINNLFEAMRKNENAWHTDTSNIFMTGDSAGAQLSYQISVMKTNEKYAALFDFPVNADCIIRAIGPSCGLYDLRYVYDKHLIDVCADYACPPDQGEKVYGKQMHCSEFVDQRFPATFIITSVYDELLRYANPLYEELRTAGVECELHVYGSLAKPEVGHSFNVYVELPDANLCNAEMCQFFKKHVVYK